MDYIKVRNKLLHFIWISRNQHDWAVYELLLCELFMLNSDNILLYNELLKEGY